MQSIFDNPMAQVMLRSCALVCLTALFGCQSTRRSPSVAFSDSSRAVNPWVQPETSPVGTMPVLYQQQGGSYSLKEYVAAALARHPKVQAARWAVDAAAWQVPIAGSLEDPTLSITALPAPIETAAGRQNVIVGIRQKAPIREKRVRQEEIACAATEEAKARLRAASRDVVAQVREVYAELVFRQEALQILNDERELLVEVIEIVVALYKTDKVSQQDIAQAELAQLTVEQELVVARQQLKSVQTAMARLLKVPPQTDLLARNEPCLERLAIDVESLMMQAVNERPELQVLIARANQDHMTASLAKLDYIPDPTFGASWVGVGNEGISAVANGEDAVLLNLSMNLPLNRNRIEAKIKSAEAKAMSSTREYDDLRDETLRVVYDAHTQLESKLELIELLRSEIIPKADETLEVAVKAYSVSEVDVQQVLENWRKLIRLEMSLRELERDYRKSLATLGRALGTDVETYLDCGMSRLPSVDDKIPGPNQTTPPKDDKELPEVKKRGLAGGRLNYRQSMNSNTSTRSRW